MAICIIVPPLPPGHYGLFGLSRPKPGEEYIEVRYKSLCGNFRVQLEGKAKDMKPEMEYQGKEFKADAWREPGDEWEKYVDRRHYSGLLGKSLTERI